jgi:hypothetical protein
VQKKPIVAPHAKRPEIPTGISLAVMRALERDPARRWQSAGELATELRRAAREAYGEPPHRKAISAFAEEVGGEELGRLQRLIRLGTEGAAVEAIEAEHPGVTRVLAEDASGVARVGTGALRTAVLDDGEEEDHGPPTVLIAADDVTPSNASADVPTAIFEDPTHQEDPLDRTDPIETKRKEPVATPTSEDAVVRIEPAQVFVPPPPPSSPAISTTVGVAIAGIAAALCLGIVIALVALWPSGDPEMVVLPIEERPLVHIVPAPPMPPPPRYVAPAQEPAPIAPPPPVEVTAPVEAEVPAPAASAEDRAPAPRARRPRRTSPQREVRSRPPEQRPPSGSTPRLMGVQDFDRRTR